MTYPEPTGAGSQVAPPPAPEQPVAAAKKPRNTLGILAFVAAVLGFVFACIPGALIVGWILLPVAFILGIVSLFQKGKGKGLGIAAIILSVVGTIVGVVVFLGAVGSAVDDALGGTESSVGAPVATTGPEADAEPAEAADDAAAAAPADGATGTRENPAAIGSTITGTTWTAVVNSYTADGNATVAAGNMFNDAAPAGSHYEIVNYTVTYTGQESAYAAEVGVDLVTSGGNVLNSYDALATLEDSMILDELFNGASATGSQAFLVPDGESVLVRVRPGYVADEVFVQP